MPPLLACPTDTADPTVIATGITTMVSILLYEPYANEYSQICPFLAGRAQFDSDHH